LKIDMHEHLCGGQLNDALRRRTSRPFIRPAEDGTDYLIAMNADFPFTAKYFDHTAGPDQMAARGLMRPVRGWVVWSREGVFCPFPGGMEDGAGLRGP
jgi:hypothetical protein